jgi:diaminopimelate epimerase
VKPSVTIDFTKMNGAGNDFILIDCIEREPQLDGEQIAAICDRQRGIGADGVLMLLSDPEYDFRMRYYNRDGGAAEMCGNGARCLALFAANRGFGCEDGSGRAMTFSSSAGTLRARVEGGRVAIEMTDAVDLSLNMSLQVEKREEIVHFIYTGVPHVVVVREDAAGLADEYVERFGRAVRAHRRFEPQGCNVNFASHSADGPVVLRTYERGVEQETLACGTGAIAAAIIFKHLGISNPPVALITRGGDTLQVSFTPHSSGARNVVLEGPAQINYTGTISI